MKKYVAFPHLSKLGGSGGSGAYVMKWSGFSLKPLFLDWLMFYAIGIAIAVAAQLGWRSLKKKRKATTTTRTRTFVSAIISLLLALLIGSLFSATFNKGSLDPFLSPVETHMSEEQNHVDAPFLFTKDELVDTAKTYNSIPGVLVVKELGVTLGFLVYFFGGAASAGVFGPVVVLCAVRHNLANPKEQSRYMDLSLGDNAGSTLLAVMSDGPLAFQTTYLAADNSIVTMTKYRNGLDVMPVKPGGKRQFVETEVDAGVEMDTDVVAVYESVGRDVVKGTSSLVVDDGLTLESALYDTMVGASSNYVPVVGGGAVAWRALGRSGGGGRWVE